MAQKFLAACIAWLAAAGVAIAQAPQPSFDQRVIQKLESIGAPTVPGFAYAVVENSEITETGHRGVRRAGSDRAVTDDTTFLIGSISKSFTALAVMQLVEAGLVDLEAPVATYLPDFADVPAGIPTIRQLLSHTSGLSTVQGNMSQGDYSMATDALERRVALLRDIHPASAPDTRWEYSNANYQLLGRVIEQVSDVSFSEYIETRILEPIGMRDSFVHRWPLPASAADGHMPWFGGHRPMRGNRTGLGSAPQGGVVASARDLARYLAVMMNEQDDILSAAGKARMMQPASETSPDYGFGWFVDPAAGLVFHSGSNPGHESLATMRPRDKLGVVVLSNAVSGIAFSGVAETLHGVSSVALGRPYEGENRTALQVFFAVLVGLALAYAAAIVVTWRRRARPSGSGRYRRLSTLLAILLSLTLAPLLIVALPASFGATFAAVWAFQPDTAIVLATVAALAMTFALLRISVMVAERRDKSAPA